MGESTVGVYGGSSMRPVLFTVNRTGAWSIFLLLEVGSPGLVLFANFSERGGAVPYTTYSFFYLFSFFGGRRADRGDKGCQGDGMGTFVSSSSSSFCLRFPAFASRIRATVRLSDHPCGRGCGCG